MRPSYQPAGKSSNRTHLPLDRALHAERDGHAVIECALSMSSRSPAPSGAQRPFRVVPGLAYGMGLVATRAIPRGGTIARWAGAKVRRSPTYQSVQIGERAHADDPECLNLLNHSCDPNVRIHVGHRSVVALRRIEPGELLTFFYPSTEWRMARPFRCGCGSPRGLAVVTGARDLPTSVLRRYPTSAHILRLKRAQARRLRMRARRPPSA